MLNKTFSLLAVFFVTIIGVELVAFTGVSFLKKRLVFYNSPLLSTYYDYMENRDPILG